MKEILDLILECVTILFVFSGTGFTVLAMGVLIQYIESSSENDD